MTNTILFRDTVQKSGIKYKVLAQKIGITPQGLQKKIENSSQFKADEIMKICVALNLNGKQRDAIFFDTVVDFKTTT